MQRRIEGVEGRRTLLAIIKILIASAAMGAVIVALLTFLPTYAPNLFNLDSLRTQAATVLAVGIPAVLVYFGLITLLRVQEVQILGGIIRARLGRRG